MDERKSWKWLIFAYSGVGVAVLAIGFFIARSAGHNGMIVAHAGATATPAAVAVYSGIAPDATATPAPSGTPSAAPSASGSASASPVPSDSPSPSARASGHPTPLPARAKRTTAGLEHKHAGARGAKLVADTGVTSDGAAAVDPGYEPPAASRAASPARTAPPALVQQTPPPSAVQTAPPVAPAPVTIVQAPANEPIFAPERVVDAQVRVAVQPDESESDRERGAHGTSVVLVTIDSKGNVVNAAIGSSSGYSTLDRAALAAARASEFVAPKINGRPATETYRLVYDFGQ